MKKAGFFILLIAILASGCTIRKEDTEKLRDIDFTVVESEDVPEELRDIIQEKQENETKLFYADEGYLYVVRGYGKQDTSGYSVEVRDCYETENTICVETKLLGPPKGEEIVEKPTYPCVVIKMEYSEKDVVFN
ncbi:MAG: protease complex subunit PrcB family protein [Lachnospiraceae bacterium]